MENYFLDGRIPISNNFTISAQLTLSAYNTVEGAICRLELKTKWFFGLENIKMDYFFDDKYFWNTRKVFWNLIPIRRHASVFTSLV